MSRKPIPSVWGEAVTHWMPLPPPPGDEDARRLADMVCPECSRPFRLRFDIPSEDDTLVIGSCGSGGIYSVAIRCPHCYYQEDLC